jgi:hypothetical protein
MEKITVSKQQEQRSQKHAEALTMNCSMSLSSPTFGKSGII